MFEHDVRLLEFVWGLLQHLRQHGYAIEDVHRLYLLEQLVRWVDEDRNAQLFAKHQRHDVLDYDLLIVEFVRWFLGNVRRGRNAESNANDLHVFVGKLLG